MFLNRACSYYRYLCHCPKRIIALRSGVMKLIFIGIALMLGNVTWAQSSEDVLPVFAASAANGQSPFAQVPSSSEYIVTSNRASDATVRFTNPTVPVWVSNDYVAMVGDHAEVIASRLNMRTKPSMQSTVLGAVERGYKSKILARDSGFVQILAPTSLLVSVPKTPIEARPNPNSMRPSQGVSLEAQQHRLAPGDTISLRVFGEQDLSMGNIRIPQSGQVSFPLVGTMLVVGKTLAELEQELRGVLSQGYVKNPRLSVSIDSYRPIFVLGAAHTIGSFPYSEGLTVAKAIAVAGGAKNSAKQNGVKILREGEVVLDGLAIDSAERISSGDIVSIEEELGVSEEASAFVYLHGEVMKPGEYEFRRGLTIEKAVVLAGGFTLRASRKRISVSRIIEGQEAPEKMKKVELYMPVKPGDIIDVGASWF